MPKNKITTILSEIDKFFDKKDASSAMFNIMRTINSLRLSEKVLIVSIVNARENNPTANQ